MTSTTRYPIGTVAEITFPMGLGTQTTQNTQTTLAVLTDQMFADRNPEGFWAMPLLGKGNGLSWNQLDDYGDRATIKRLVLVDPKLRGSYNTIDHWLREAANTCTNHGQYTKSRILRGLADQISPQLGPPKPDEPLGLGAVVIDTDGVVWVRGRTVDSVWRQSDAVGPQHVWRDYEDIAAVEVLGEGTLV